MKCQGKLKYMRLQKIIYPDALDQILYNLRNIGLTFIVLVRRHVYQHLVLYFVGILHIGYINITKISHLHLRNKTIEVLTLTKGPATSLPFHDRIHFSTKKPDMLLYRYTHRHC